jgi:hypothetical protein
MSNTPTAGAPARREQLLEAMDETIPWDRWGDLLEPHRYCGRAVERGRRAKPVEMMLRMHLLQVRFSLSDEGAKDPHGILGRDRDAHALGPTHPAQAQQAHRPYMHSGAGRCRSRRSTDHARSRTRSTTTALGNGGLGDHPAGLLPGSVGPRGDLAALLAQNPTDAVAALLPSSPRESARMVPVNP